MKHIRKFNESVKNLESLSNKESRFIIDTTCDQRVSEGDIENALSDYMDDIGATFEVEELSDNELFTIQDIKDAVTISFRWGKPIEFGEGPEKFDKEEKIVLDEVIKELRIRKNE